MQVTLRDYPSCPNRNSTSSFHELCKLVAKYSQAVETSILSSDPGPTVLLRRPPQVEIESVFKVSTILPSRLHTARSP